MSESSVLTQTRTPGPGEVQFGDLRRLQPIDPHFGMSRGRCIDRYYIEGFLGAHAQDVRGRVLEVADPSYTRRFGGDRVTKSDVVHVSGSPDATIVADLTKPNQLPADVFDCIICTQTLQCIYDVRGALRTLHHVLKPGGVLLATLHGISQISRWDMDQWGEYWRFTSKSAALLFGEMFPASGVSVASHGNVLTATAFLHGIVTEELEPSELDYNDPDYQLVITVRAVKALEGGGPESR